MDLDFLLILWVISTAKCPVFYTNYFRPGRFMVGYLHVYNSFKSRKNSATEKLLFDFRRELKIAVLS